VFGKEVTLKLPLKNNKRDFSLCSIKASSSSKKAPIWNRKRLKTSSSSNPRHEKAKEIRRLKAACQVLTTQWERISWSRFVHRPKKVDRDWVRNHSKVISSLTRCLISKRALYTTTRQPISHLICLQNLKQLRIQTISNLRSLRMYPSIIQDNLQRWRRLRRSVQLYWKRSKDQLSNIFLAGRTHATRLPHFWSASRRLRHLHQRLGG
jgi:hypothetical protein